MAEPAIDLAEALAAANATIRTLVRERDAWRRTVIDRYFHLREGRCPDGTNGADSRDLLCPGCTELDGRPAQDCTLCMEIYCFEAAVEHGPQGCTDPNCPCPFTPRQVADRWGTPDLPSAPPTPPGGADGSTPPAGALGGSEPRPELNSGAAA